MCECERAGLLSQISNAIASINIAKIKYTIESELSIVKKYELLVLNVTVRNQEFFCSEEGKQAARKARHLFSPERT